MGNMMMMIVVALHESCMATLEISPSTKAQLFDNVCDCNGAHSAFDARVRGRFL
jgi:hypothetical protein